MKYASRFCRHSIQRLATGQPIVTVVLKWNRTYTFQLVSLHIDLPTESPLERTSNPTESPPMNLYLMRHANAGVRKENPLLDARRGLIKEGKQQCMLMAGVLNALKVPVDVIVSSPLKRSLQTAQFVGTEVGYEQSVVVSPALAPQADYAAFHDLLIQFEAAEGVLMVGHNPNLQLFLGRLLTGNGGASLRLRKGAIARIDMTRRPPQLQWLIDPRLARTIYTSVTRSSRPKTSRK